MPSVYAISDLHLEFRKDRTVLDTFPAADILVLAGDIGNVTHGLNVYREFLVKAKEKYQDVIFIAGNHEYYGCQYDRNKVVDTLYELAEETETIFLHRTSAVVQGIKFVGVTLWSLIDKAGAAGIEDFNQTVFRSEIEYVEEFILDYRLLRNVLETSVQRHPVIVVTHHLPTSKLIHRRYCESIVNRAFASDVLDALTLPPNVKMWICGHTHEYMYKKYGQCQLLVNPLGYPNETRLTSVSDRIYDFVDTSGSVSGGGSISDSTMTPEYKYSIATHMNDFLQQVKNQQLVEVPNTILDQVQEQLQITNKLASATIEDVVEALQETGDPQPHRETRYVDMDNFLTQILEHNPFTTAAASDLEEVVEKPACDDPVAEKKNTPVIDFDMGYMYPLNPQEYINDILCGNLPCRIQYFQDSSRMSITPATDIDLYDARETATGPCILFPPGSEEEKKLIARFANVRPWNGLGE